MQGAPVGFLDGGAVCGGSGRRQRKQHVSGKAALLRGTFSCGQIGSCTELSRTAVGGINCTVLGRQ